MSYMYYSTEANIAFLQRPDNVHDDVVQAARETFKHHTANPGPAIPQEFNVAEEGTKEERRAKAQELNK